MRSRRSFSREFKREIVETVVSGQANAAELSREYHISPILISKWKKDYKKGKFFDNVNSTDIARLELKVRELERLVGELTMENRMLKKVRDLANKEKKEDLSIITSRTLKQLRGGAG
ncbi:unnamed protein product [marine sediment metagenome]|uniref:Transposase n=2 Tax=marine sediment metagenome TaxID=412755 RepID=X1A7V7_9ZZZZ